MSPWRHLDAPPEELRLDTTLKCGQAFRWKASGANEWSCAFKGRLITLRQTSTGISYQTHQEEPTDATREFLVDYFQLERLDLRKQYTRWGRDDGNFARVAQAFPGVRILRQDPVENLICFICSSNNNIARISLMADRLCARYGDRVGSIGGVDYYDFPSLERLAADDVEEELRRLGFGYRARYVAQAARYVVGSCPGRERWLYALRDATYANAREALMQLSGVGPKVADCVCLMSLDKHDAIPVDTHVWQIARRDYGFRGGGAGQKTLTARLYTAVGDHFRELYGEYSGWAHTVLFVADLKTFGDRGDGSDDGSAAPKAKTKKRPAVATIEGNGDGMVTTNVIVDVVGIEDGGEVPRRSKRVRRTLTRRLE